MKQYIFSLVGTLTASLALFCACTEDPEPIVPHFPEVVTATVAAGESYTLHIEPNTAWTVAVSSESATYFHLLDEGSKVYTMRGAAGSYDLTIGVASIEEFDTERMCEVKLTLGEGTLQETRTIAILTRGKIDRNLTLYAAAEFDEEASDFSKDEADQYIYSEQPATAIELVKNLNDLYLHRIVVESNYAWSFAGELPAWLDPSVVLAEVGRTEVQLRTKKSGYPFEDTVAEIGFNDMTEQHAPKLTDARFTVSIPGCAGYVDLQLASELKFNADGQYNNEGSYVDSGAIGWLTAPVGAVIYKAVKENGFYYTAADRTEWMVINESYEEGAHAEAGLWMRTLTIKTQPNTDVAREGVLIVVPQSLAATITDPDYDLFNAEGTAVKDSFAAYSATIFQSEPEIPGEKAPIEIASLEALRAFGGNFEPLKEDSWIWNAFDVEHAYCMNYPTNDTSSGGDLKINTPYATVEIIGFDATTVLQTTGYNGKALDGKETSWVTVEKSPYGIEDQRRVVSRLGENYPNTCPGENGENEAFLLFKDAEGKNIALIYFVLDPNYSNQGGEVVDGDVAFVDPSYAAKSGAKLARIVEGDADYSKEDEAMGVQQYRLTYTKSTANEGVYLKVPAYQLLISQNEWLWAEEPGDGTIRVQMDTESGVGILNIYDASWQVIVKIICVADLTAGGGDGYDPYGAVTFFDQASAESMGATLLVIDEEDESYDKDLGYKGIPQYRLMLKQAGSITLKVPTYYISWCYQSWLTCAPDWPEEGSSEVTITMQSTGSSRQVSNLTLYVDMSEGTVAAQIQCVLLNE